MIKATLRMTGITVAISAATLAGCEGGWIEEERVELDRMSKVDVELVRTYYDTGVRRALIAQHTLYPYHFVDNAAQLNDLGLRDLTVLAEHYQENPGPLNVRRGKTPDALYDARVAAVRAALADAGVHAKIDVGDALPGGQDMPSEKVIRILQDEEEDKSSGTVAETTFTTKGVSF